MSSWNRLTVVVAGLAVGLASGTALGAPEPDVVVSTIGSTYSKYGTKQVGSQFITGYAVTTVSCNIGNAIAEWFDHNNTPGFFDNEHPVIGTQLYRLHNGRFEMIAMNWLKHGFCAADAPNCLALDPVPGDGNDTYVNDPSCDWLGLFATDTYGASLNGDQTDCGPRSEINPATGAYPYPYIMAWNATGDCAYKRLAVDNADLNPANYPGARYFTEVHYITTDETQLTRRNNASYRETLVGSMPTNGAAGGGCNTAIQGYPLTFTGATIPLKPAIEAWKTADPSVILAYVDVNADGRIIVGSKATDLGNGTWQYEYAVYNHNSDRSVGRFSIPKSSNPAATFSSIGFKDIAYHSGEPYDGTDWTATVSANTVSWETVPHSTNANANAIRWSTSYNFRFVSNRPPTTGNVTLGLFKPGAPASIDAVGVHVPSLPPNFCPADFNQSGGSPTVQDIFDFLAAYFNNSLTADFNQSGGITVQDIFDFLAAYFTACP